VTHWLRKNIGTVIIKKIQKTNLIKKIHTILKMTKIKRNNINVRCTYILYHSCSWNSKCAGRLGPRRVATWTHAGENTG